MLTTPVLSGAAKSSSGLGPPHNDPPVSETMGTWTQAPYLTAVSADNTRSPSLVPTHLPEM